jgi:hypothetical protein
MLLKFLKKEKGGRIICQRQDGSHEIITLGTETPYHDLAHYVIEQKLNLRNGFYGNLENGYTLDELNNTEIIKTLPAETAVAEVMTRALQSLGSGACTIEGFNELIEAELQPDTSCNYHLDAGEIAQMLDEYKTLTTTWSNLSEGESMELSFPNHDSTS